MEKLYSKKEVAALLNVTIQTINNWMKKGIIKATYLGSTVRFKESEIKRLLGE